MFCCCSCRDSKLTRLLGEALGGVCKTSIIATVSPCSRSWDESLSTLRYAQSAMNAMNIEQMPKARRLEIQVQCRSALAWEYPSPLCQHFASTASQCFCLHGSARECEEVRWPDNVHQCCLSGVVMNEPPACPTHPGIVLVKFPSVPCPPARNVRRSVNSQPRTRS